MSGHSALKRILFVTHDASRTGAPLFLLHFMRWMHEKHPGIECDLLIRRSGELDPEYMSVAHTTYQWQKEFRFTKFLHSNKLIGRRHGAINNLLRHLTAYEGRLLASLGRNGYDLVFVNSFANAPLIPLLANRMKGSPIICRPPELKRWVEDRIGVDSVRQATKHVDRFIAVSDLVAHYLRTDLNIPAEKIVNIPGFIRNRVIRAGKSEIRSRLGIADDAFLVCGSGTLDWRKGVDLFVHIAADTSRRHPDRNIRFCWIGGGSNSDSFRQVQFDLDLLKVSPPIVFVPSTDSPLDYFSASDLFALTSREDPFPLVALEAASCGLPIVCFDAAVGSKEFVNDNTGKLIPYLDTAAFTEAIASFQCDHGLYDRARHNIKMLSDNYSIDRIGNRLLQFMLDTATNGRTCIP